jgi:hypothetical protein
MSLRLNGSTSGYTEIDAPAVAGSNTLVLPTGNGTSGQVLTTNGSGALSWAGAGKILQVVSTTKTDSFSASLTSAASTAVTGLSASITPSSSAGKILVICHISMGAENVGCATVLKRDSTAVCIGNAAGSRARVTVGSARLISNFEDSPVSLFTFLDSPATTSSTTYSVDIFNARGATNTVFVNRGSTDSDLSNTARTTSTITIMEVAA